MKIMVVATALLLASTLTNAQEPVSRFYVIPNLGHASFDADQSELDDMAITAFEDADFTVTSAESSLDDKDTAWSLVAGWQFSSYFATEVGYLNLGEIQYGAQGTLLFPGIGALSATADVEGSAKGPTIALVALAPIGKNFDAHVRAGLFFAKTKLQFDASITHPVLGTQSASDSPENSSEEFFYGVGVAYHFTHRLAATVDYLFYKNVGDESATAEVDVDSITIGVVFGF